MLNKQIIVDGYVTQDNSDLQVIVLDTRYHRDPLRTDGSILGSAQWAWLEKELKGPDSAITIIGSSIQVSHQLNSVNPFQTSLLVILPSSSVQVVSNLSASTGPLFYLEGWGRFPKDRDRLFKLIADVKVKIFCVFIVP